MICYYIYLLSDNEDNEDENISLKDMGKYGVVLLGISTSLMLLSKLKVH